MNTDNRRQEQSLMPYASLVENKNNGMQKSRSPMQKKLVGILYRGT
jgi:hypothetical protein